MRLPTVISLTIAALLSADALAAQQDSYPGSMCNSFLANVGPNNGTEIVNGTAAAVLVDCPFRRNEQGQQSPTCPNTTQTLDYWGSSSAAVSCSLRATQPEGWGWVWSPTGVYLRSTFYEYFWSGNYQTPYYYPDYGTAFECLMQPNSRLRRYSVFEC